VEKSGRKNYMTGMEEVPEKIKQSSHSALANGINEQNIKKDVTNELVLIKSYVLFQVRTWLVSC
jgi:hypothetical protein